MVCPLTKFNTLTIQDIGIILQSIDDDRRIVENILVTEDKASIVDQKVPPLHTKMEFEDF